ncbi:putative secreted protein [Rhodopirellula maiorica SM1]|uniref:Putative secreted protein n=1 Tax=Rhodopirellula maiorica SM1 TaxID=1265738 RepID=M5RJY5_9BACT|nr:right-handed parallel beta-helix repeat-containing protein [Rhodopirellula maiorica]EMI19638.1 putative secreted protein [Rhodopirellula maiorica SM1]
MKFHVLMLFSFMLAGGVCGAAEPTANFFVATDGRDEWSGTLTTANPQRADGPFATLERARDAVRDTKNDKPTDIVVLVRGGRYQLNNTIVFGLEDSAVGDATITYAAYPGETPVFSSGREIKNWKKVTEDLPGLPTAAHGNVLMADVSDRFFTLYDDEGLLPRARSAGFIPLKGGSRNRLHFPAGKLKDWSNIHDVEIVVRPHHAWIVNILPLESVDESKQIASTSIDATYAMNSLHFLKTTDSCWVENVLDELDQPGEWVLNTQEDKLYLWPRNNSPVLAAGLTELIRIEGEIDKPGPQDTPVRNLCFRGLTFLHGERYSIASDDAGLQHDWEMYDKASAMVRLRGTENCRIEQCRFAHSGSGAIRIDLHGQQNTLSSNVIEHIGGTGILLCGYGPGTKDVNRKNLVYNNHIHHTGQIYSHSPGIMVWQSGENRVANNLVHHTPYTGIILSGCMTDFFTRQGRELGRTIRRHEIARLPRNPQLDDVRSYLHTRDNVIEYNEIHHAMESLGDGNAIYIRGAGAGNQIRHNYIHHLVTPMIMQAAIRTDGGQMDTTIAGNLIYKCMSQGIILKLNNRCENNIVAEVLAPPRGYYLSLREGPLTGAVIQRNIFYSTDKDAVFIDELSPGKGRKTEDSRGRALARASDADTDYNIYYCAVDPALGKQMLAKQQQDGVDAHSRAVDPLFVDPANGDFRLRPDSPALELGFVQFDKSKVGLVENLSTDDSPIQ